MLADNKLHNQANKDMQAVRIVLRYNLYSDIVHSDQQPRETSRHLCMEKGALSINHNLVVKVEQSVKVLQGSMVLVPVVYIIHIRDLSLDYVTILFYEREGAIPT